MHLSSSQQEGRSAGEPLAIVGMACRFPGAENLRNFRRLLRSGRDAFSEVPADRWDADAFYDPDPEAPGKMMTRRGAFLERVDAFDADFFGITPREAERMDPQQRLLSELCWEAFENAGISLYGLDGSNAGVFVGIGASDYQTYQLSLNDHRGIDATLGPCKLKR